jgi:cytochrome c biogenesis protein CcdA
MITIKALINHIRGWLPKEPSLLVTTMVQGTQKTSRRNLAIIYLTIFVAVFATVFVTIGIFDVLGLEAYSNYAAGATTVIASILVIKRSQNSNIDDRRTKP